MKKTEIIYPDYDNLEEINQERQESLFRADFAIKDVLEAKKNFFDSYNYRTKISNELKCNHFEFSLNNNDEDNYKSAYKANFTQDAIKNGKKASQADRLDISLAATTENVIFR